MFVEYLFIITKKWKQTKCHSAGVLVKKINRLWYTHAIEQKNYNRTDKSQMPYGR